MAAIVAAHGGKVREFPPETPPAMYELELAGRQKRTLTAQLLACDIDLRNLEHRRRLSSFAIAPPTLAEGHGPGLVALVNAGLALQEATRSLVSPRTVFPSVEGGVTLGFVNGKRRAYVELYNDNSLVLLTYVGTSEPSVQEWVADQDTIGKALAQASSFIRG